MDDYSIKKLSDEELEAYQKEFPKADRPSGPWQLKDGKIRIGFYATEEEAVKKKGEFQRYDLITDLFDDWVDEIAHDHGMQPSEVNRIVGEHLN
jgi:hypothetical protein